MLVIQAGGRVLALRTAASGCWRPAAAAFVLVGAARAVDAAAYIADPLLPWSLWWTNLAYLPLAGLAGLALVRATRDWPTQADGSQESATGPGPSAPSS
jgi:TRAP-type C4-dicarboxylate transport system permease small subunit